MKNLKFKLFVFLFFAVLTAINSNHVLAVTYYVNAINGSDTNDGKDSISTRAWKTLAKVSATTFLPGDIISLKRGQTFTGICTPLGSGSSELPITLGAYGGGAKPIISFGTNVQGIKIWNQQYWKIENLEVVGQGKGVGTTNKWGVLIGGDVANQSLNFFRVTNVTVHDVGSQAATSRSGGIVVITESAANQSINDVIIDGCTVYASKQWRGILYFGSQPTATAAKSTNATVRNCTVNDVWGDGILVIGVNGGTIENCVTYDVGVGPTGIGPTQNGIWTWNTSNVITQFNEAYNSHSFDYDGGGFDIDYFNSNNTVQYNYSHDNDGYGVSIFGAENVTTTNSVVRYNILANNGRDVTWHTQGDIFVSTWNGGSINGVAIYNNTSYWSPYANAQAFKASTVNFVGTNSNNFKNNLIYSTVTSMIDVVGNLQLNNNLYWHTGNGTPTWKYGATNYTSFASYNSGSSQDVNGKYANPLLNDPTYHAIGKPSTAFTLQAGSPAINAGANVGNMGARDFFGNSLNIGGGYDIGAQEYQGTPPSTTEIILDNTSSEFTTDATSWPTSSSVTGYEGANYAHDNTAAADVNRWAKWTPNVTKSANYEVFMKWTANSSRPDAAPIEIKYNGGTDVTKTVNQTLNNGTWVSLGTYSMAVGTTNYVMIKASDSGYTIADAVKFTEVAPVSLILDNTSSGFTTDAASWPISSSVTGYEGTNYAHDNTAAADVNRWAKWTPNIIKSADYEVFIKWTANSSRPDAAPIEIKYNGGTDVTKTVNQTLNSGTWVSLGTYSLAVGTTNYVMIKASDVGYTIADAVKFTEVIPSGTMSSVGSNQQIFFDFTYQEEEFLVYPNPAEEILSITTDKSFNNSDFKLYDMSGRVLLNGIITNLKTDISVINMPRGMYVLDFGNSIKRVKKKIILK